jgi:uncharacterized membrane protein
VTGSGIGSAVGALEEVGIDESFMNEIGPLLALERMVQF